MISDSQLREAYSHAVKLGVLTQSEADARAFAEHGLPPANPATPTRFEADFDRNFAPAKPEDYPMPYASGSNSEEVATEQAAQGAFRQWLAAGDFPRDLGGALMEALTRDVKELRGKTNAERASWRTRQESNLRNVWGDKMAEKVGEAEALLALIERRKPGISRVFRYADISYSASAVMALQQQAARLKARGKL
jgi:hypothetical protein